VQSRSSRESPFVNVNGAECLSALSFTVTGLATGQEYGFRVFASGLNEEGPDMRGGNILYQRPVEVPQTPVQISLVSTYRTGEAAKVGRATLSWSVIDTPATVKYITAYKVQISPDGKAFFNSLSFESNGLLLSVYLPEVSASPVDDVDGALDIGNLNTVTQTTVNSVITSLYTVTVDNLLLGTTYWLRVVARNANLAGYSKSPPSNTLKLLISGAPPPVLNLKTALVTSCMELLCGCYCCGGGGTNTCDGLADMTIQWNTPVGAFTVNRFKISTFLGSMLVAEGEKSPTPEGEGADGSYTLAVDGSEVPLAATEEFVIRALPLHHTYTIRVAARNDNIEGYKYSANLEAMPADLPSVSVEDTLKVTEVTGSTVSLEWRPVTSQPISFYKVDFDVTPTFPKLGPDSFFGEFPHESYADPARRMRMTVTELTPGIAYYFLVTPRNLNLGSDGASAFVKGYRSCPTSVSDLVVTSIASPSNASSLLAFRLSWSAPTSPTPIRRYRIWHSAAPEDEPGRPGVYLRLADFEVPMSGALSHEVDGFSTRASPHLFLVTPVASHCALIGPVVPQSVQLMPDAASILSVTGTSVTLRWRRPGCPHACAPVAVFFVSVSACATSASIHTHASSMRDCEPAGGADEATSAVLPRNCAVDSWCVHTTYGLTVRVPVRIRVQSLI